MSFKDLALPLAARGVPVIPVQPLSKATYVTGGEERGTTDTEMILAWDKENPDYNVGCLGTPTGVTIFDCDEPGLVSRIQRETGRTMPRTFAVKAINGGGHLYFRQTDASRRVANKAGEGVFELRGSNLYVVGPGSKAPDDKGVLGEYRVACDAPIADFPDWLEGWILANISSRKGNETGEVDQDSYIRLRKKYLENLNPSDMLGIANLTIQSLHPTLHSLACLLHDGRRAENEVGDILEQIAHEYGHREARGRAEIDGIVSHAFKKAPTEFTLDESHPALESKWVDGLHVFGTQALYDTHMKERVYAEYQARQTATEEGPKRAEDVKYPSEVWAGTEYAEFADICSQGNYIPREFLIEALKTVTGSVLGGALEAPDIEGGVPRFYTVLMGYAGSGKGTSISWASSVFKDISLGGTALASLLWSPATKIEDVPWTLIGACEEGFNSAPGMQRSNEKGQTRWLQTFEELDHMIEGSGIEGSGKALMGVNRQLYDREDFATTTTGKRDAIAGRAKNSLIAGTTPEIWTDMFAGKQVRGSGLFQRFNLLASEERRRKGTLKKPKLDVFKVRFAARIMDMDKNPITITAEDRSVAALDEWYSQDKFADGSVDAEVRGRLNVLAWRNAIHLAWQRDTDVISIREILDAIKLSEYQFEVRVRHTPAEGVNQTALVENKILNFVQSVKRVHKREVYQRLNMRQYGNRMFDAALCSLQQAGEIQILEEKQPSGQKSVLIVRTEEGP